MACDKIPLYWGNTSVNNMSRCWIEMSLVKYTELEAHLQICSGIDERKKHRSDFPSEKEGFITRGYYQIYIL
jgi:hypothetical protein